MSDEIVFWIIVASQTNWSLFLIHGGQFDIWLICFVLFLWCQVVLTETKTSELELESFLLPNIAIDDATPLSTFYVSTITELKIMLSYKADNVVI